MDEFDFDALDPDVDDLPDVLRLHGKGPFFVEAYGAVPPHRGRWSYPTPASPAGGTGARPAAGREIRTRTDDALSVYR